VAPLQVALVFHHHQPWYVDPTGTFRFPYVFTNAPRYAAHLTELEEHPGIRVTYNVQPTLLEQWYLSGKGFRLTGPGGTPQDHDPSSPEARASRHLLAGYRGLARGGRCEFLTSPYYHPIMALLASRGMRGDLEWHLREGRRATEHFLDAHPRGLWVPEMAFNMEASRFMRPIGLHYTVLEGSLMRGKGKHPYQPYALETDGGVTVFLRHTHISNHLAFDWNKDPVGRDGADQCLRHLRRSARGRPFVVLALDGENWMKGKGLLHHLFSDLEDAEDMETVTLHELLQDRGAEPLESVPEGSWGRNHDLSTWVGSPAKDRLWAEITETRRLMMDSPQDAPPEAWRCLYIAEGSDYTYWDTTKEGPLMKLARAYLHRAREIIPDSRARMAGIE
jgi:alpha-amylase/alpha-mannosidase (GH57 family)